MTSLITTIAGVLTMPARAAGATAAGTARTLRDWSGGDVDDWGCDSHAVAHAFSASRLRWDVAVGGTEHLPRRGGALIVANARSLALAPLFAALAIGDAAGRPVRFVGRPDIAPIGPLLQRLGGLLPIADELEGALRAFHRALKPGGVLGVVDHRARPELAQQAQMKSGYVREDLAIALIEQAGFRLVAKSEVNANPKDSKDHPEGVWTLPPTYRLKDRDRAKYQAIGESDRFTLKFVKR